MEVGLGLGVRVSLVVVGLGLGVRVSLVEVGLGLGLGLVWWRLSLVQSV